MKSFITFRGSLILKQIIGKVLLFFETMQCLHDLHFMKTMSFHQTFPSCHQLTYLVFIKWRKLFHKWMDFRQLLFEGIVHTYYIILALTNHKADWTRRYPEESKFYNQYSHNIHNSYIHSYNKFWCKISIIICVFSRVYNVYVFILYSKCTFSYITFTFSSVPKPKSKNSIFLKNMHIN